MPGTKNNIVNILIQNDIVFYGYDEQHIPDLVSGKTAGRVDVFSWNGDFKKKSWEAFLKTGELCLHPADVCFLDHKALKFMVAGFPSQYQYFFLRIAPRVSWVPAFLGLARRVSSRQVRILGHVTLQAQGRPQRWLAVENTMFRAVNGGRRYLNRAVGVQGFLDFLRREKIRYVVLRFYDKLPKLHREGGDVDILVADEDEARVHHFFDERQGTIKVDIWSVSRPNYRQMTYYSPPLARSIISNAVDGPAGSKIPAPREAFLSFAYHALYHKGLSSGIPSTILTMQENPNPENDYAGMLSLMAKNAGIGIPITMESLDEYLFQEGWRPKLDTLSRFVGENEWVYQRFFAGQGHQETGIGFFVLKKKALSLGLAERMVQAIEKHHFIVIMKKEFDDEERVRASEQLRGGSWSQGGVLEEGFLPAMGLVVMDTLFYELKSSKNYSLRIRNLKEELRARFDSGKESLVHATDNTHESWDYISVCFPGQSDDIKNAIKRLASKQGSLRSLKTGISAYRVKIYYYVRILKAKARNFFIRLVIR